MGVKKLLTIITTFLVGAMLFNGLYQPEVPLMWLASTTVNYAYMRAALVVVLIMLLVTRPPRSPYFRTFLMAFSSALFLSTVLLLNWYAIGIMDAVIFIEVSIILMIEGLEATPSRVRSLGYNYTFAKKK